jgi:hypothetical protein
MSKTVGFLAILALIGVAVAIYLHYRKVKEIQRPQDQQFDPFTPQKSFTQFTPLTFTQIAGVAPFSASNI